ncbi:hypothetical protein BCUE_0219 [Candidatus Kinetoplastibacterium blastocrithidii TCC012E]|uniref:Uncharacterized protein n=1 Tax=Candidatus Kinetoplastidibacterium blastocrithidiae TCC012E TaxID=1208922 RepID=M1LAC9_9PROT|nr:hypothetical protein [Candidatus Kinetoplastibacterium blastocrithidii]AFZ83365.1 hypothetical protein CKBE_00176 [Candidatus Kinetoplastibacterium blastocrithidii (ex Strigomonas culicis)]AGF49463.1 hypothetical protein BCUE_0219 [Candidatus Kinetoplastibacterium blastocrithidii TCC012E]
MLRINRTALVFTLILLLVICIVFIDKWLTNNNPLSMDINNRGSGIMRLNADGKQHIAQPPQPSSDKLLEKYMLRKDAIEETKDISITNQYRKKISPEDQKKIEKDKMILLDEMSKNIKTIDLTK